MIANHLWAGIVAPGGRGRCNTLKKFHVEESTDVELRNRLIVPLDTAPDIQRGLGGPWVVVEG